MPPSDCMPARRGPGADQPPAAEAGAGPRRGARAGPRMLVRLFCWFLLLVALLWPPAAVLPPQSSPLRGGEHDGFSTPPHPA